MQATFIVTFIGDDRPGLVEELSGVIEKNGGNWHESRLSQLGGKFAGLVLVALPAERESTLRADLAALSPDGLEVTVTETVAGEQIAPATGRTIHLTVIGPDRPGIVREISRALAQRRINVQEMDSAVDSAPMSAESIFRAHIHACIPESTDMLALTDNLDEIANNMTLEIDLE